MERNHTKQTLSIVLDKQGRRRCDSRAKTTAAIGTRKKAYGCRHTQCCCTATCTCGDTLLRHSMPVRQCASSCAWYTMPARAQPCHCEAQHSCFARISIEAANRCHTEQRASSLELDPTSNARPVAPRSTELHQQHAAGHEA